MIVRPEMSENLCQLVKRPTATSEVVASDKLILASQHNCGGVGGVGSESRIHPSAPLLLVSSPASIDRRRPELMNHSDGDRVCV